ncbi:PA2779 family protein [Desulfonatronum thioautotrophicum]|uniref:PA2779 family protein n=1 Tax=Desulfonatronum thioautotrophicum TaxID=617001 RepID=UPI00069C68AE|nr:PA2779 family protein [Desulfonatronum thioautotrophicum]
MSWQKRILQARLCWVVLTVFCFFSLIPPNAEAFLVQSRLSSGELISERSDQIATIQSTLEQKVVAQRLSDYGLSKTEVMAKLDTMSDEQVQQLADLSGDLGGGAIGTAIGVLLVILLVVVILRVSDRRIVVQ